MSVRPTGPVPTGPVPTGPVSAILSVLVIAALLSNVIAPDVAAQTVSISVDPNNRLHKQSRFLTGACIEDVNHEIYGGIYSQMVFGESFQEPSRHSPVKGFEAVGGSWQLTDGVLTGGDGNGPKLVRAMEAIASGEVAVEVRLPGDVGGNGGLIIATSDAKIGADNFVGYEVSLDSRADHLVVGRHNHDFNLLAYVPVTIPHDQWIPLRVQFAADHFVVFVNNQRLVEVRDPNPLPAGAIGFRQWQRPAQYRNLTLSTGGQSVPMGLEASRAVRQVSGMWDVIEDSEAEGRFELIKEAPFVGEQSQRIEHQGGKGSVGLANRGLNRWGMTFRGDKVYEGYLWLRNEQATTVSVSMEEVETGRSLATQTLSVDTGGTWKRYDLSMQSGGETSNGQLALRLGEPGRVDVGHVFWQPGSWGRFKDLPLRRDVVQGLIDQGITVLRYGGSMVDNPPNYRWKNMIGPRGRRQPYDGHWYDYSTNGWGILDFLDLCDAAGFMGIPCFSIDETPQDMVDFLEYANGPADSDWGAKRVADGRTEPYKLRYIQLGNEESVNQAYWERYEPIARALWQQDPELILIVGDFQFDHPIENPFEITGSPAGITTLAAHQKILALAKELDTEVWFDTHMWTGGPDPTPSMNAFFTFVDALERLAEGAKHRVAVFEFNANNHRQRRALANAEMIGRIMRDGRIPVALSANCLQPDGQNDNGWDQGLLFLNSSKVWLQPPGYVTQMVSRSYQPWVLKTEVRATGSNTIPETLDVVATGSDDKDSVIVRVVNRGQRAETVQIELHSMTPKHPTAKVLSLAAALDAHNTAQQVDQVRPQESQVGWIDSGSRLVVELAPFSFTTITIE